MHLSKSELRLESQISSDFDLVNKAIPWAGFDESNFADHSFAYEVKLEAIRDNLVLLNQRLANRHLSRKPNITLPLAKFRFNTLNVELYQVIKAIQNCRH